MPTKKVPQEPEFDLEEEFEEPDRDMSEVFASSLTAAVPEEKKKDSGPRVTIFLPKLLGDEDGMQVDQYEHVTIANEQGEMCYKVLRGEYVDVPIAVFIALKEKYPKL